MADYKYSVKGKRFDNLVDAEEYAAELAKKNLTKLVARTITSDQVAGCKVSVFRADGTLAATCSPRLGRR
jgi:hypothetical protein